MAYLINKDNVRVGVAHGYWARVEDEPELPADTVDFGGDWGSDWIGFGATTEGIKFGFEPETQSIHIEESSTPALVIPDTVEVTVETELAEDTLETMLISYGGSGSISTTAAGPGSIGKKELNMALGVQVVAVGLEMKTSGNFWRRILIPKANSVGNSETSYRRAENSRTYPVTFTSICDVEDIVIVEKTADALP
jgi:hypothetical protein